MLAEQFQCDASIRLMFAQQQGCDQEPGQHEEDVHSEEPTRRVTRMEQDDEGDAGEPPKRDRGQASQVLSRTGMNTEGPLSNRSKITDEELELRVRQCRQ